jgi:hypothetical protein
VSEPFEVPSPYIGIDYRNRPSANNGTPVWGCTAEAVCDVRDHRARILGRRPGSQHWSVGLRDFGEMTRADRDRSGPRALYCTVVLFVPLIQPTENGRCCGKSAVGCRQIRESPSGVRPPHPSVWEPRVVCEIYWIIAPCFIGHQAPGALINEDIVLISPGTLSSIIELDPTPARTGSVAVRPNDRVVVNKLTRVLIVELVGASPGIDKDVSGGDKRSAKQRIQGKKRLTRLWRVATVFSKIAVVGMRYCVRIHLGALPEESPSSVLFPQSFRIS